MRQFAAALIALGLSVAGPAAAASPADTAAEAVSGAAGQLAEAGAALESAGGAVEPVAALTAAIVEYEGVLGALRTGIGAADARQREIALELRARRSEIAQLLAALESYSAAPPPELAMHPAGPLGAARTDAMLAVVLPAMEARAAALAGELREIEAARAMRQQGIADLQAGLDKLATARTELDAALAARASPPLEADARFTAMLRESDTLTEFCEKLDAAPAAAGPAMALATPVVGETLRGFREPDAAGVRRPGILLVSAPIALVTAPAAAQVRYAGPFLDYGYVVVLEARADVLIALGGLATLEVRTGDAVAEGALLGRLGGRAPDADEFLMIPDGGTGVTAGETLYIEVRHGRAPVDPAPWFAGRNG